MTAWESIKKFLGIKKKRIIHVDLDPESVKTHHQINALANENADLKGEIARLKSEFGRLRVTKDDQEEEEKIQYYLDAEQKAILAKNKSRYFSLSQLFKAAYGMKPKARLSSFGQKLNFTTWDRSHKIARFGDIGLGSDGTFILLDDKKKVVFQSTNLKDIFQSIAALGNDVDAMKIPVNVDSEGRFIENLMLWEAPELIVMGQKFAFSKVRKKPVFEVIKGLNGEISTLRQDLEESEMMNIELTKELEDSRRTTNLATSVTNATKSEISKQTGSMMNMNSLFNDITRDILQLRNMGVIHEDHIQQQLRELERLRTEAERSNSTTNFQDALTKMDLLGTVIKRNLRQIQHVDPAPPTPQPIPSQNVS